jgi:GNAT superfamily N-acetyltransferase
VSLAIRPARPGDAPLINRLVRELAVYEKLEHEIVATDEAMDAVLFGPNPRVFGDIAEWDGEGVGFSLWYYSFSSFEGRHGIYLEDLYVRDSLRGKGIGKALLIRLARRCVDENLARFEWSVLDWNTPSIEFYKAMGAELMDDWTMCRVSGNALQSLAERDV